MKKRRCKTCQFLPCRCEDLAAGYMGRGHSPACWPMTSEALSCHPSQVKDITERNKKHGVVGVSYLPDGTCVIADRGARKALMALEGVHDKRGGYGDDHGGQSPLYREDSVPFDDTLLRERSVYQNGRH